MSIKFFLGILVAALLSSAPFDASAFRPESLNIIYFNANNNVIGQDVAYCNNIRWRGGSQVGTYSVLVIATCGSNPPDTSCGTVAGVPYCTTTGGPGEMPGAYLDGNYGTRTLTFVCNIVPQACDAGAAPPLMTGYGFNSTFVQY